MSTSETAAKPAGNWTDRSPRAFGSLTPEEYIAQRINPIRAWYDKKASEAKRNHQWMRACTVVGGALVPVLTNVDGSWAKTLTTGISLLVLVLLSLESVFHYREQWKNYRSTEQSLEKEYFNFVAAEGAYRGLDGKKAFLEFVDRVEGAIASENSSTLNVMTTVNEQKTDKPPQISQGDVSVTGGSGTTVVMAAAAAPAEEPAPAPTPAAAPPAPPALPKPETPAT
nr:DUF4231 domain-containing protein [uncultured Roseateles sp.]